MSRVRFALACLVALSIVAAPALLAQGPAPAPPGAAPKGDPGRGAAVYRSRCAICHKDVKALARRLAGADAEARAARMEAFLATHHAPDATPRRDVVAFLRGQPNK